MENEMVLNVLFGSVSSLLLAVVAYFIKQLHSDFKKMEKDITEVKTMALLIKTEFKNISFSIAHVLKLEIVFNANLIFFTLSNF